MRWLGIVILCVVFGGYVRVQPAMAAGEFSDDFENGTGAWTITKTAETTIETSGTQIHTGSQAIHIKQSAAATTARMNKVLGAPTIGTLVVYFYDASVGSSSAIFVSAINSVTGEYVVIGTNTGLRPNTYDYKTNSAATSHLDTLIPRTAQWHKFEIITTPVGTYAKIDNQNLANLNPGSSGINPVNTTLKSVDTLQIGTAAGAAGEAYIDSLNFYPVALRKFPYPYQAGFTVTNDLDHYSPAAYEQIHSYLNTLESTPMGPGLGLDIGDSMWFYNNQSSPNTHSMTYFQDMTTNKSALASKIRDYVYRGWIDSLHAYGNFNGMDYAIELPSAEPACPAIADYLNCKKFPCFQRSMGVAASDEMVRQHFNFNVWINHGDANNRQDVESHQVCNQDTSLGDNPIAPSYHTDLAAFQPIKFVWSGINTFSPPASLIKPVTLDDGRKVFDFTRLTQANNNSGVTGLPTLIPTTTLDALVTSADYLSVYNHMGMDCRYCNNGMVGYNTNTYTCPDGSNQCALPTNVTAIFQYLANQCRAGKIWVTNTEKLLWYNLVNSRVNYTVTTENGKTVITIDNITDETLSETLSHPDRQHLNYLTFYTPDPANTIIRYQGQDIPNLVRNPADYSGLMSVTIPAVFTVDRWPDLPGDTNLNGTVDYTDAAAVQAQFPAKNIFDFQKTVKSYAQTGTFVNEGFDQNLADWIVLYGAPVIDQSTKYQGPGSLKLDYTDTTTAQGLRKVFPPLTDVIDRVYFYDNMDQSMSTIHEVKTEVDINIPGAHTGIGVDTSISTNDYIIRVNGYTTTYDTKIPRSLGWHLFEMYVSQNGTWAKIDNRFVPYINHDQMSLQVVDFISTRNLPSIANYDEFSLTSLPRL